MNENSLTGRHSDEKILISEREMAIQDVIKSYIKKGVVKKYHLSGDIINLFAHVGTAETVLRPFGGNLTTVELDENCVQIGIELGKIIPYTDNIASGTDASDYISFRSVSGPQVDFITCFGTGDWYFKNVKQFHADAMKCLRPGGLLLMTGTHHMKEVFNNYEILFGGQKVNGGMLSHAWDAYQYFKIAQ